MEAAILSRKRKSSLVEDSFAENESGLKILTETPPYSHVCESRVAERPVKRKNPKGNIRSENSGMSNVILCLNHKRRKSKGSHEMVFIMVKNAFGQC